MYVYLVHHGAAVPSHVDPQRPLSVEGRTRVEHLAQVAAGRDVKPAVIWHSGKLRARQTAHPYWRACNPLAAVSAAKGLQPSDPPERVADALVGETRDVMLVGHMPHIQSLLALLVGGRSNGAAVFPQHGIVALTPQNHLWVERWRLEDGDPATSACVDRKHATDATDVTQPPND